MMVTWELASVTQATATVNSCTSNCLWEPGEVVTLKKFYGDMSATSLPKTGQTQSYYYYDDGYYQMGIEAAGSRFTDNGDGTVTDHQTGLIWQKEGSGNDVHWFAAIAWCHDLCSGYCGFSDGSKCGDWRLPNINELKSIVDYSTSNPSINTEYFPNTFSSHYWSSTTYASSPYDAWGVYFGYGGDSWGYKSSYRYVRAVRGGQ